MSKANVTKLDNGGYDVEFEGGGRVILNEDEASNKQEAEKVARERFEQASSETPRAEEPAEEPTVAPENEDSDDSSDDAPSGDADNLPNQEGDQDDAPKASRGNRKAKDQE